MMFGLLAAACSPAAEPASTSTTVPPPPVDRLVVLGDDGNVFTVDPDGSNRTDVTDDAGGATVYFQPVWSPDGARVAFGSGSNATFRLNVADQDGTGLTATVMDSFPFFYYWDATSTRVGLLRNDAAGGLAMEVVSDGVLSRFDTGAPFYFSWEPSGSRLVWHIGTDRLEIVEADGSTAVVDADPGAFQAPQWTESGIFFASSSGGDQTLVRLDVDEGVEPFPVAQITGFALFSATPDGSRVAVQGLTEAPDATTVAYQQLPRVPFNQVAIIDVETGDLERVTEGPALAFFWSPVGDTLLILSAGDDPTTFEWSVRRDGTTTPLARFTPSPTFLRDFLPFFDQYAQSMTLWSPAGDRFAFPGRIDDERGVWVQPIDGSAPSRISEGVFVGWSPR